MLVALFFLKETFSKKISQDNSAISSVENL
jgi:hypothetical protein